MHVYVWANSQEKKTKDDLLVDVSCVATYLRNEISLFYPSKDYCYMENFIEEGRIIYLPHHLAV